jgi:hypothetical protein
VNIILRLFKNLFLNQGKLKRITRIRVALRVSRAILDLCVSKAKAGTSLPDFDFVGHWAATTMLYASGEVLAHFIMALLNVI